MGLKSSSPVLAPLCAPLCALMLALALPACDRKAPPTGEGAAPIEAQPSADPRADMRGRWTIDPDRLAEQPALMAMPPEQRQLALEMSHNLLASMTVRFDEGTYAITTAGKTVEGSYTIVEQRGPDLVLALTERPAEGEAGAEPEQVRLRVDSRGLVMTAGDDVLPLRRRAPAEGDETAEAAPPEKTPLQIAAPPGDERPAE